MTRIISTTTALLTSAFICSSVLAEDSGVGAQATTPMRPAKVTWGGVSYNDQIAGSEGQWPFVAKYMDGFLMHGAYWLFAKDEASKKNLQTLGEILKKNGKQAHLETGFGETDAYDPSIPTKRQPYVRAQLDISKIREFRDQYGIDVSKVRVDWFPMTAMGVYAEKYGITDMRKLMAMVTGAKEFGPVEGFDMKNAHWVEYCRELQTAFPKVEIGFDQALCNHIQVHDPDMRQQVPWKPFGYGYKRLVSRLSGKPYQLDGKQVEVVFDFADQLNGLISSSRENGFNFIGFEGDTPFSYYKIRLDTFPGDSLVKYIIQTERYLHSQNLKSARIINDCGKDFGQNDKGWLRLDLGSVQDVDCVKLIWGRDYGNKATVTTSVDGKIWTPKKVFNPPDAGVSEVKFKTQQARFLKVEFRQRASLNGYQVAELEAYGPSNPGVNLALNRRVIASSVNNTHPTKGGKNGIPELIDGDRNSYWESEFMSNDDWDRLYHDRTLEYLEFYQSAGGRADEYIAESWYEGPFTLFPETKHGTFSNLARDLIRKIKGLDDTGAPMPVTLEVVSKTDQKVQAPSLSGDGKSKQIDLSLKSGAEEERIIRIRNVASEVNPGDARCTPLLRIEGNPEGFKVACLTPEGKDVTTQAFCQDGFDGFLSRGLEPGQTQDVILKITRPAELQKTASASLDLKLYWNPQDPQAIVRDSLRIKLN